PESESHPGADSLSGEIAQHLGIFVGDAFNLRCLARFELRESTWLVTGQRAVECGNGVAVWVKLRVSELGGDALFESLGDEVLEALGLLVHFVPRVAEDLMKKSFEQSMVTNNFESALLSGLGELDAAVLLVDHKGR